MSNQHKKPTISFRVSDAERKEIEAQILASGMKKQDYFVRSASITASVLWVRRKLFILWYRP